MFFRRTLTYISRVLLITAFSIPLILFFALQNNKIQTYINQKISDILYENLNTKVYIKNIFYSPPFDFHIENLFIPDYQNDTLIFVKNLKIRPVYYSFKHSKLYIDKIYIKGIKSKYKIDTLGYSNLDYFLANIPPGNSSSDSSSNFSLFIRKIELSAASFSYLSEIHDTLPYQFNTDTIIIKRTDAKISDFKLTPDSISLNIDKFKLYEKKGFRIRNISGKINIKDDDISLSDFLVRLNKTRLLFDKIQQTTDTINNIKKFNIILHKYSFIDLSDLGYFSKAFKKYHQRFQINFALNGAIDDMNIKNFNLKYKNNTIADFQGKIIGITSKKPYFDLKINKLSTSANEIINIKDPLTKKSFVDLPNTFAPPSYLGFNGILTGTANNFKLNGFLNSTDGNISLNIDYSKINKKNNLEGLVKIENLNIGKILKNNTLGLLTLHDTINITFDSIMNISGINSLTINKLEYNDYTYKNILLHSNFNKKLFKNNLTITDSNLSVSMELNVNYNKKIKTNFNIYIDTAKLYYLNFTKDDKLASTSFGLKGNAEFSSLADLECNINFNRPLILIMKLQKLEINNFSLNIKNLDSIDKNHYARVLNSSCDFYNAQIKGVFDFERLGAFFSNIPKFYFPSLTCDSIPQLFDNDDYKFNKFKINLTLFNMNKILDIFAPGIYIANNTNLSLKKDQNKFSVSINSDSINFSGNKLSSLKIKMNGNSDKFTTNINIDSLGLNAINFQNFNISTSSCRDSANFWINWNNKVKQKNFGKFGILLTKDTSKNKNQLFLKIPKDTIYINDVRWTITSKDIHFDTSKIFINNFWLSTGEYGQNIGIKGIISDNPSDTLRFFINNFDIGQLNPILDNFKIGGILRAEASASDLLGKAIVSLENVIEKFEFNDVKLGFIRQNLVLNMHNKNILTNLSILRYGKKSVIINGKSTFKDTLYNSLNINAKYDIENFNYDVLFNIDNLKIKPFSPYFKDYLKFARTSNLNGKLHIYGDKIFYNIMGYLNLYGAFKVIPTGVTYTINGGLKLEFLKNLIKLHKTVIVGPNLVGDATLQGEIKHHNFKDFYLDMSLKADTIEILNLPRSKSQTYYGRIITSGNIDLTGFLQNLSLKADITPEDKTNLTILLDKPGEVSNKTSILEFVQPVDSNQMIFNFKNKDETPSTFDLDLNLALNPAAKFKIVFNEMTGEAFEIQGYGNLKIKKTAFGNLVLYGKIGIQQGVYNFILQNIINRRFSIKKGSSITFRGSPTEGQLDITTVYSVKNVSLYSLLMDDRYMNEKTQADCYIYLKGPITKPKIKFGVELPKADRKIASQVSNLDEANINKQFISLLLLGRFQPLPGLVYDPNANMLAGTFNAGELISNQLNSLLSNLGTNVNLDVNYITGSDPSQQQFDVALSIPLLNERVTINTDVGVIGKNVNAPNQNNFIGDFDFDIKLNKKGNLLLKGYNKSNRNNFYEQGYTRGIGILYKSDLDNLFKKDSTKLKNKKKKKRKKQKTTYPTP